jgi:spore maturation protein SpmA
MTTNPPSTPKAAPCHTWPWQAFIPLAGIIALVESSFGECRCWYSEVTRIEKKLALIALGLIAIRFSIGVLRKEAERDGIIYIWITLATPFIIHLLIIAGAGFH